MINILDYTMDQVEQERRKEAQRRLEVELELKRQGVVRALLDSRDGQCFLRWIMEELKVFQQEFPADDKLAAWTAGRRAFGLQLLGLCAAVGKADILLAKEADDA